MRDPNRKALTPRRALAIALRVGTALAVSAAVVVPAGVASSAPPDDLVSEIGRIPGLATFAELLASTGVARSIRRSATPKNSTGTWYAVFAFTDNAWRELRAEGAEWRARTHTKGRPPWKNRGRIAALLRAHIVPVPARSLDKGPSRIGIRPLDTVARLRNWLLAFSPVPALDHLPLRVTRDPSSAVWVLGGQELRSGQVVVFPISRALYRHAFVMAKMAFHEARQDADAIEKGDEEPAENVPSFFGTDDDDGDS